jgi:SAM-dependent methyltransferase
MITTKRYSGRSARFANTLLGRLYHTLYIHPSQFYGDLQHEGILNWHARIKAFVHSFPREALVLDIGSGARRITDRVLALDISYAPTLDLIGDAHHLPLRDASLDGVVLQMVLEHVAHPEQVLQEVYRVLKPGGRMYCEVPFLFPVHDRIDYRRWTPEGLAHLCKPFATVETGVCMGPFSALSAFIRRLLTLYAPSLYIEAAVDLLLGWLLWPLKYLDRWLPAAPDAYMVAGGIYVVGTKDAPDASVA